MFGQFEPAPAVDEIPHSASCAYHHPDEWTSDAPECSHDCAESARDEQRAPRVRRAA